LILPANVAWERAEGTALARAPLPAPKVSKEAVAAGAAALKNGGSTVLLLGGAAVRGRALELAGRIAARTGCRVMSEFANARAEGGAGRVAFEKIPYVVDLATATLAAARQMVLVGSRPPVSFFAYPDKPSLQAPPSCLMVPVARVEDDVTDALEALADALGAAATAPVVSQRRKDALPTGPITPEGIAAVAAALLPENAIVVDESVSTGRGFSKAMTGAAPHDWMSIMGGSIGWGLPAAVGAAVAAPDRKVVVMESDGSAMYTVSALWTMAREGLDVTILMFANRSYRILEGELKRMGGGQAGSAAMNLLALDHPALDWKGIATGNGLAYGRAETLEALTKEFGAALRSGGPSLIEVVLP
jgi:acetolactate synthase-1/2/3 large subunit